MRHIPVLLNEVTENLNLKPGDSVIDCTLGDGGHAEKILETITKDGKFLGIDADPESLMRAKQNLYNFADNSIFVRDNFVNLKKIVAAENFGEANGILMDLGWSTPQFKERGRGFSFEGDEPLDMRYSSNFQTDNTNTKTAAEIINNASVAELASIFKDYGEENFAEDIAQAIDVERKSAPITTTAELREIILRVYREKLNSTKEIPWIGGIHPATKVFQALRIAVNTELEVLKQALPQAIEVLTKGGRLAVISFHSLEDRIVKHYFQSLEGTQGELITKKPIIASANELENNPSARSAKLRVFQKNK